MAIELCADHTVAAQTQQMGESLLEVEQHGQGRGCCSVLQSWVLRQAL